eukprot:IDg18575t1
MRYNQLFVRVQIHVGQLTKGHMQYFKKYFARRVITLFKNRVHDMRLFCNMDETAVKLTNAVHTKGDNTVSVHNGGSSANRCTVFVTVAMDGTELLLFVIFKGARRLWTRRNANLVRADLEAACEGSRGHVCTFSDDFVHQSNSARAGARHDFAQEFELRLASKYSQGRKSARSIRGKHCK